MAIFNPKPILDRMPEDRQARIALAVKANIDMNTVERFRKGLQVSINSLEKLVRMTDAPYREVFSEDFFNKHRQN